MEQIHGTRMERIQPGTSQALLAINGMLPTGAFVRTSAKTRSWENAERRARLMRLMLIRYASLRRMMV